MIIRPLSEREKAEACALAWKVFLKFEAPEYSQEGIDEFRSTLDNPDFIGKMEFYGAFDKGQLVGMLAMRKPQHISLFFVKEEYHRRGIGKKLFERMKQDYEVKEFTVNSSPYAVDVYKHLGFIPTDTEQLTNGIRYTPMKYVHTIQ
jgi:GNAT superfamily N-acetyltransferase